MTEARLSEQSFAREGARGHRSRTPRGATFGSGLREGWVHALQPGPLLAHWFIPRRQPDARASPSRHRTGAEPAPTHSASTTRRPGVTFSTQNRSDPGRVDNPTPRDVVFSPHLRQQQTQTRFASRTHRPGAISTTPPLLRADSSYSMWADRKFPSDGHEFSLWAVSESPSIHQCAPRWGCRRWRRCAVDYSHRRANVQVWQANHGDSGSVRSDSLRPCGS